MNRLSKSILRQSLNKASMMSGMVFYNGIQSGVCLHIINIFIGFFEIFLSSEEIL